MTEVDVIIISWAKTPELRTVTQNCLDTLYSSETDVRFNPVIVESAPDVEYNWGATIHPKDEFGYNKYCNLGRKAGKAPWVALCNNDIMFHPGWATIMLAAHKQFPQFRSMSPWCPRTMGDVNGKQGTLLEGYQIRNHVAGWCLFHERGIYDAIGDLDEKIRFWYADNDYALLIEKNGIKHCVVPDALVTHEGADWIEMDDLKVSLGATARTVTADDLKEKYMWADKEYVEKKWDVKFNDGH
uniref:Putative glycosyltransferase n=1 Tax=viral metagenome TaxID=1070528 RepID=A0A6M3KHF9_9ZZZZ